MKPRNPKKRTSVPRRGTISPRPVSFINNDPPAPPERPGEELDNIRITYDNCLLENVLFNARLKYDNIWDYIGGK